VRWLIFLTSTDALPLQSHARIGSFADWRTARHQTVKRGENALDCPWSKVFGTPA